MSFRDNLIESPLYLKLMDSLFKSLDSKQISRYKISKITGIDQTRLGRVYNKTATMSMNEFISICENFSYELKLENKEQFVEEDFKNSMSVKRNRTATESKKTLKQLIPQESNSDTKNNLMVKYFKRFLS